MATYGLQSTVGRTPFTGYTNTLGSGDAVTPATSGYVWFNGITQGDGQLAALFRNNGGQKKLTALLLDLLGVVSGSTASYTYKQVAGQTGDNNLGGVRPIETITVINRASTAADITAITALINRQVYPSSYPADLSGNGGGGKGAW